MKLYNYLTTVTQIAAPCLLIILSLTSEAKSQSAEEYNVGILVMDGVYNTELTAPYDIFQHTKFRKGIKPLRVFTVSENGGSVKSFEGLKFESDYSFKNVPSIDILVVPAAEGHLAKDLENKKLLRFIRKVSKRAMYITSHCDGAFLLAAAGIPDGTHVTTFPSDQDEFEERFPELKMHRDILFVHDGKWITSIGGAKSFEAALYLCHILYGEEVTKKLASGMAMEWDLNTVEYFSRRGR